MERSYFKNKMVGKNLNYLCLDAEAQKNLELHGIIDNEYKLLNHSYLILRVFTCHESRLRPDQLARGVQCKSFDQINQWRMDKKFRPIYIEPRVNFLHTNSSMVQYHEKFFQAISMQDKRLTDAGFRFRYNEYNRTNYEGLWQ